MKRIEWLDIAKYFFIMVVILEHLEAGADELSCLIVPYTLPGFFFVSGYTHKSGQPFKSFAVKKIRTLFIPWLILTFVDITLSQLVSFGDGYVEIELVAKLEGLAIGVATNEETRQGVNQWKRERLISAGANAIIPDFRNAEEIIQKISQDA